MIKGSIYKIQELSQADIRTMYDLMSLHYENIKYDNFVSDLKNKEEVVVLKTTDGQIKGFSTIVFSEIEVDNIKHKILFSGDTIVHKEYWAHNNLANVWLQHAIKKQQEFNEPLYWLLISKGYKTYKYLNTFFKEYYPNPNKDIPQLEQQILDKFGKTYYPQQYDAMSGLLIMNKSKDFLKEEYANIPAEKMNDFVVKYFLKKNPEYYNGNELICITNLSLENVNNAGKRLLGL